MKIFFLVTCISACIFLSGCKSFESEARQDKSKDSNLLTYDPSQTQSKIEVKGEVRKGPVIVKWYNGMTAWDAIQEAGGITRFAADCVWVYRAGHSVGKQTVYWSRLIKLFPNDVVVVDND